MNRDIPCVVTDIEHADLYMPVSVVIVTEEYLLEQAEYIASFHSSSPVFLWSDDWNMVEFALQKYKEVYGIEFENSKINHAITCGRELSYCSRNIRLTRSERRILYFLMYNPGWYDSETIAAYCLKGGKKDKGAVAVHICNMNNKVRRITPLHIIDCKRYLGYRMKCEF